MRCVPARQVAGLELGQAGSQPSALRPMRRSIRGLYAPSQIGTSCAGAGPALRRPDLVVPAVERGRRRGSSASQNPRMTSIASSSALDRLPRRCVAGRPSRRWRPRTRRRPSPSSARPPESRSRLAADRASTAGGRSGRFSTLPETWIRAVRAATHGEQRPGVQEPRLVRVILERDQVQPRVLAQHGQVDHALRRGVDRSDEAAEPQLVTISRHGSMLSTSPRNHKPTITDLLKVSLAPGDGVVT